jgi:hypothetical protein
MVKAITIICTFCITGAPQVSALEVNSFILAFLYDPYNATVVTDVSQEIQQFYYRNISSSAAVFSDTTDVRNNFVFCSHSTHFSICFQLGCFTVREKLRSSLLGNKIMRGVSKVKGT